MKSLHEPGVAVYAAVGATGVAIKRVIVNATRVQQASAGDFTNHAPVNDERFRRELRWVKQIVLYGFHFSK
jgi:hypothetical protein